MAGHLGCSLHKQQADSCVLQAAMARAERGQGAGDVQKLNTGFQNKEK